MRKNNFVKLFGSLLLVFTGINNSSGQYNLVWSDEFNGTTLDSSIWNYVDRVGVWNTGSNQELERYRRENVTFANDGNGNNCLVLTAKKENYDNYPFTSGRIDTKGKFSFKYGKLEARIKIPSVANGLWPAFWTLGYTNKVWPECGEIDILEAGNADGIKNGVQNKYISGALHWEFNNNYAGYGKPYTASVNLNEDFHIYTLIWDPNSIKIYLDNSATPYYEMNISGADVEEFKDYAHYIIFDLAVGGMFTGIYNMDGITATLPAEMLIDYVRLYQKTGEGELNNTPNKVFGDVGVYSENTSYAITMDPLFDLQVSQTGLNEATGVTPQEGKKVLAYTTSESSDFEIKTTSLVPRNMSNYTTGSVQFYIRTNYTGSFQIGISDNTGNSGFTTITTGSPNNPSRDNTWKRVIVPLSSMTPAVNLANIKDLLIIKGTSTTVADIAIDNVIWSEIAPETSSKYLGLYTEKESITSRIIIDNSTINLFIWENTLAFQDGTAPFEGEAVWSVKSANTPGWYGFGVFSANPVDLSYYKNGYLHVAMKTTAPNDLWLGIAGANKTEGKVEFKGTSLPYGFKRDGQWHELFIPCSDLTKKGWNPISCDNVFMFGGGGNLTSAVHIDDVYLCADKYVPPVSIKEEALPAVSIYPSVVNDVLKIYNPYANTIVEVYSIDGKIITSQKLKSNLSTINLNTLNSGIYMVKVKNSQGVYQQKIIKK